MRVTRSTRVVGGIVGMQYLSSAAPGSEPAEALGRVQRSVGGPLHPSEGTAVPHLFFAEADGGNAGTGPRIVGLWVPIDQQRDAESLLRSAGFELS